MIRVILKISLLCLCVISLTPLMAQAQFIISGNITNPEGDPVVAVDIFLYDEFGTPIGIPPTASDIDGFYSIAGLPLGTFGVGFEPQPGDGLLSHLHMGLIIDGDVTLDEILDYGNSISGFVRDSLGNGIFGIDLNVYDQATGNQLSVNNDDTDTLGFYSILVPFGTFRLKYRTVGQTPDPWVPIEIENLVIVGDTIIDVTLIWGNVISGTVRNQSLTPVFNVDLDFTDVNSGQKILTPGDHTDNNGQYQVLLPGGTYDISVAPQLIDGLVAQEHFGVVITGDAVQDYVLNSGFVVSGTISNSSATPIASVDIDVRSVATGAKLFTPFDKSDEFGFYQVIIPGGNYDLIYQPPVATGLAPQLQSNLTIAGHTTINVTLQDGLLLSGTVENSFGVGVSAVDIDIKDHTSGVNQILVGDRTDVIGQFAVIVVPGNYDVEFEPPVARRLAAIELLSLPLGLDTTLAIVVDTGFAVSGVVTDSIGTLLPDIVIKAIYNGGLDTALTANNVTDLAGQYEIVVASGLYDLLFIPDLLVYPSLAQKSSDNVSVTTDQVVNMVMGGVGGNAPPILNPIGNKTVVFDNNLNFVVSASDPDGGSPIMSATDPLPPGATFLDQGDGTGAFSWTPVEGQIAVYQLRFYADDGQAIDSEQIAIDVNDGSRPCGDANGDFTTNVGDAVFLINFVFKGGTAPDPLESGNANCDATSNVGDAVYLINFVFKGGAEPCAACM